MTPIDRPYQPKAIGGEAKRVLITIDDFVNFGGAEMVVVELVEWFVSTGWSVDVLTRRFQAPIAEELSDLRQAGRLLVHQNPNKWLDPDWFDLVWISHSLFPLSFLTALAEGRPLPKMVWAHMGSLVPLEAVNFLELETITATHILAVSLRTQERIVESGIPPARISIFDNPVPARFGRSAVPRRARNLEQLVVVSNHPPDEVLLLRQSLPSLGIRFLHIGNGGDFYGRVTPEVMATADAVVTIGKTTQYCLAMGIPVYSYDHFGGAGWIDAENYRLESAHNFSGYRTQRKLAPEQIVREIVDGFPAAQAWTLGNRRHFANHYSLERQVTALLDGFGAPQERSGMISLDIDSVEESLRGRWNSVGQR